MCLATSRPFRKPQHLWDVRNSTGESVLVTHRHIPCNQPVQRRITQLLGKFAKPGASLSGIKQVRWTISVRYSQLLKAAIAGSFLESYEW